jgi:RNA polymerase sigma-70 factor (ECF subfamily)
MHPSSFSTSDACRVTISGDSGRHQSCAFRMTDDATSDVELLNRLRLEGAAAVGDLFAIHRNRLRRMVEVRLDQRLTSRVDASDVLQDAYVDAAQRLDAYLRQPGLPPFLWLRLVVGERLLKIHRHHLGTQMREAGREVSLFRGGQPAASSVALAAQLLGGQTSPTEAAARAERAVRLQDALGALDPVDREILSLRHFEELTHAEAARVLDIEPAAAAKRYLRALRRLKEILADTSGV